MILSEKNNLFNGYSDLLLLNIYSDKIVAEAVKKDKGRAEVILSATEPVEGEAVTPEKIRLNCQKAIQRIPAEQIAGFKNTAFVLAGEVSKLSFAAKRLARENKIEKISAEEISELVEENRPGSAIIEKRILVDGFSVEDPIGIGGEEITASVARVDLDEEIEKALISVAKESGLAYEGVLDARTAFLRSDPAALRDACIVFVYSEIATICVVRGGFISAVSDIDAGYGIIIKKIARLLEVGAEESKSILDKFKNNQTDQSVSEKLSAILRESETEIVSKIRSALSTVDKDNLLPGNVFVVIEGGFPGLETALSQTQWLAGLPIDRNAAVNIRRFNLF